MSSNSPNVLEDAQEKLRTATLTVLVKHNWKQALILKKVREMGFKSDSKSMSGILSEFLSKSRALNPLQYQMFREAVVSLDPEVFADEVDIIDVCQGGKKPTERAEPAQPRDAADVDAVVDCLVDLMKPLPLRHRVLALEKMLRRLRVES